MRHRSNEINFTDIFVFMSIIAFHPLRLFLAFKIMMICMIFSSALAQQDKKKRIVFIGSASDEESLWKITKNGALSAARTQDFYVQLRNPPTGRLSDYISLVDSVLASTPDALVMSFPNVAIMESVLIQAVDLAIPIIAINSDINIDSSAPLLARIGEDSWQAGHVAGKKFKKENITNVLCLNNKPLWTHYRNRCQGVADGLEQGIDMLNLATDNSNLDLENYLDQEPTLQAIITMTPEEAKQVDKLLKKRSIEENKKEGKEERKIALASFGFDAHAGRLMYNNRMIFSIDLQPFSQGYMAGLLLSLYFKENALLASGRMQTAPYLLTKNNLSKAARYAGTFR